MSKQASKTQKWGGFPGGRLRAGEKPVDFSMAMPASETQKRTGFSSGDISLNKDFSHEGLGNSERDYAPKCKNQRFREVEKASFKFRLESKPA